MKYKRNLIKKATELMSNHSIGDTVTIDNGYSKIDGRVFGVKFDDYGKVRYDISLPLKGDDNKIFSTVIQNIDSILLEKRND